MFESTAVLLVAGLAQPAVSLPPPIPPVTREQVERVPTTSTPDPRRVRSRPNHVLQFDDGKNCTVELAHEKERKVIVEDNGIEIRDDAPQPAPGKADPSSAAPNGSEVAPASSCSPH